MYCHKCGAEIEDGSSFCYKCGAEQNHNSINSTGQYNKRYEAYSNLSKYYQEEFKKIQDSGGAYKGKFNVAAFLFSFIWALTKGLWLSAIIELIVVVLSSILSPPLGWILAIIFWFLFGFRGNWIYYNERVENKQIFC